MLRLALLLCIGLVSLCRAGYRLQDDYSTSNFFSMFDFFTADDPTHGYVNYVDQITAQSNGLIGTKNNAIYMGADSTNVASGRGRNSVRITSKKFYNTGLIILDLAHMPGGACGEWPAFWTFGPNWPNSGEIDIIEGVNSQSANAMALHTSSGCSISATPGGDAQNAMTGTIVTPNCDVAAADQPFNAGCGITSSDPTSYGTGFNANGGGVYATEWTNSAIKIWFFSRANIPADIASGRPNPAAWGPPVAAFGAPCQIGNFFRDQQIVFDVTFCGDWAGATWASDPVCAPKGGSCQAYVQNTPGAFRESFWSINSLRVYSGAGGAPPPGGQPSGVPQGQGHGQGQGQPGQGGSPQSGGQQWDPPQQAQPQGQSPNYSGTNYSDQDSGQSSPAQPQAQSQSQGQSTNQNATANANTNQQQGSGMQSRSTVKSRNEDIQPAIIPPSSPSSPTDTDTQPAAEEPIISAASFIAARAYAPYVGANGRVYQGPGKPPQAQKAPAPRSAVTVMKTLLERGGGGAEGRGVESSCPAGGRRLRRGVSFEGEVSVSEAGVQESAVIEELGGVDDGVDGEQQRDIEDRQREYLKRLRHRHVSRHQKRRAW